MPPADPATDDRPGDRPADRSAHSNDPQPTRRFPRVADLPWRGRFAVHASGVADVALRTAGASLISATLAPLLLRPDHLTAQADLLRRYAAAADAADPQATFRPPTGPAEVRVTRDTSLGPAGVPGSRRSLRMDSRYEPLLPEAREAYAAHRRNAIAWAQHWSHDDGPRPTVVVVHGFMASPYWFNRVFFALPWLYASGYDLLQVTMPFHGPRKAVGEYNGAGLFRHGPATMVEAILHAVHDLRAWIDWLLGEGVPQVGMTGLSLGGYLTATMAAVDDRLCFAIPNAPVTDLGALMSSWQPAGPMVRRGLGRHGMDADLLQRAMAVHSPLTYPAVLDRDRLFVIAGLGDRLAPPSHAHRLWEHWGRPRVHAYPGNHVLHVERSAYLRRVGRFIRSTGFAV